MAVGRYVKFVAREGQGNALVAKLLSVAEGLRDVAGCELYMINRAGAQPDTVWVTELWRSQEALDASLSQLQTDAGKAQVAEVMALVRGSERIELEPLGGVGPLTGGTGATVVNLGEVEDSAPKFGYGDRQEARFARGALGAVATGVSLHRVLPNRRQGFGHRHHHAEEVYVVISGSGRLRVDDEIHELKPLDAVRIAPESKRALEGGPDGIEVLAVGAYHAGDVELLTDFWQADGA
jgi:quinol monooxygenase YgiN/quercetin dioxygenase-like cupin family protein